jgi:competence protein ComEA
MRSRRTSSVHQEAVARRLAQLSAELEATRAESVAPASGGEWWSDHTRVAGPDLRAVPALVPEPMPAPPPPESPPLPVPGRHAAPRRVIRWADTLLPDTLRGRVLLGPGPLTVVALLVALGMAVTAWLVVRGDPEEPTVPVAAPAVGDDLVALPSAEPSPGAAPGAPVAQAGSVTVDVAGKVRRPGIAVLDAGARVVDALKAAGGARAGVDLSSLNLARVLVDGEQILVGAAPAAVAVPDPPAPGTVPGQLVNLNVASATELESLPEVGPVTAAAIIAWRESNGGFSAVDELLEIDGIGETTLGQIAPFVTV